MYNPIEIIQTSKVNIEKPFVFNDIKDLGFPMEPLVATEKVTGTNTIKIRVVVFINSKFEDLPTLNLVSEKEETLSLSINYNYNDDIPESYNSFYIEANYTSVDVNKISKIETKLIDTDPKTSRGTYTYVVL